MSNRVLAKLKNLRKNTSKPSPVVPTSVVKKKKSNTKQKPSDEDDYDKAFFGFLDDSSDEDTFDPSIYGGREVVGSFVEKDGSDDELSGHVQFSTNSDDDDDYNLTVADVQTDEEPRKKKKKTEVKVVEHEEEQNDEMVDDNGDGVSFDQVDEDDHNINQVQQKTTPQTTNTNTQNEWTEEELVDNNTSSTWKKVNLSDEDAFACEGMYSLEVLDESNEEYKSIMRSLYGDDYDKTSKPTEEKTKEEIKKARNKRKKERKERSAEEKKKLAGLGESKQTIVAETVKEEKTSVKPQETKTEEKKKKEKKEKKSVEKTVEPTEETEEKTEDQTEIKPKQVQQKPKREKAGHLTVVNEDADTLPLEEVASKMAAWNFNDTVQLHPQLIRNLYRLGFYNPTPIQSESIPKAIGQQADILAAAETGSGKTLAFVLPIVTELIRLKETEPAQQAVDSVSKTVDGISLNEIGVKNKRKKLLRDVKKDMFQLRSLILLPTRELALQVCTHIEAIIRNTSLRVVGLVGGLNEEKQIREIHVLKPDIIVATPGRYWFYIDKGMFASNSILGLKFLVIDEADRMVADAHFFELQSILRYITVERFKRSQQGGETTLMRKFISSATLTFIDDKWKKQLHELSAQEQEKREASIDLDEYISQKEDDSTTNTTTNETEQTREKRKKEKETKTQKIIQKILAILDMKNPVMVDLTTSNLLAHTLQEAFLQSTREDKILYLYYFLTIYSGRSVVFTNNIKAVRFIGNILKELFSKGPNAKQTTVTVVSLHGKMDQQNRFKNLEKFKKAENCILITTDVFARGIDIPDVENVVHFNIPIDTKTYVHRCGRSGRAGKQGFSIALVSPEERKSFFSILKDTRTEGNDMPSFPISHPDLLEVLRKRVKLAIEIEKLEERQAARTQEQDWFTKQAAAMDLELDDRFFKDLKKDKDLKLKGLAPDQERKLFTMKRQLEELLKQNVFMQTKTSISGTNRLFTVGDPRSVDLIRASVSTIRESKARGELEAHNEKTKPKATQAKKRKRIQKKNKL